MFFKSPGVKSTSVLLVMMMIMMFVPKQAYAEYVNGEYTIEFNILHADKRNASIAEGYWNQPATVFIKDGDIRVQTTINKHAWVTEFAVSYNGQMNEVKTISVDEAANSRVTEFQIANFTDLVESNVSVSIAEINYDHSYTMYFKFKPETLTLVKAEDSAASDPPVQVPTPDHTQDPVTEDQAGGQTDQSDRPSLTPGDEVEGSGEDGSEPVPQGDRTDEAEDGEGAANRVEEERGADAGVSNSSEDASNDGSRNESDHASGVTEQDNQEDEIQDASQNASDSSAQDESGPTDVAAGEPAEEKGNGTATVLIIVAVILLAGVVAALVYRSRRNQN